jgi:hypothetical protein
MSGRSECQERAEKRVRHTARSGTLHALAVPPPMKKNPSGHVHTLSARWRSDTPEGIEVTFGFGAAGDDGAKVSRWIHDQLATFDENTTAEDVVDDLRAIAERTNGGADIEQREGATVLAMIYWLRERGHLAQDERNGLTWQWGDGETSTVFERAPVAVDTEKKATARKSKRR